MGPVGIIPPYFALGKAGSHREGPENNAANRCCAK